MALQPLCHPCPLSADPVHTTSRAHCIPSWMLSSYTFMCITNVVLFRSTTDPEPSALLHVPIFSDTWSAHHSLSPGATGGNKTLGKAPSSALLQKSLSLWGGKWLRGYPFPPPPFSYAWPALIPSLLPSLLPPKPSPMMARAVALPSWLRMVSMTSSSLPSRLHRLIVRFPELIQ